MYVIRDLSLMYTTDETLLYNRYKQSRYMYNHVTQQGNIFSNVIANYMLIDYDFILDVYINILLSMCKECSDLTSSSIYQ